MISGVVPVAAPARLRERLTTAPDGPLPVVHASATAVYADLDGWCVGVVSASATRVPCALWSTLDDLSPLVGQPVSVRDGALHLGTTAMRVARVVDPTVTTVGDHEDTPSAPEIPLTHGLDLPSDGRLAPAHLDRLLGRGPGLTPLGDDVVAGWCATRAALGAPDLVLASALRRRLAVTTLFSGTLLDCALHGEAIPELAAWLAEPTPAATRALLAVGATSGAGLLAGARLALRSVRSPASGPHHRPSDRPGRAA